MRQKSVTQVTSSDQVVKDISSAPTELTMSMSGLLRSARPMIATTPPVRETIRSFIMPTICMIAPSGRRGKAQKITSRPCHSTVVVRAGRIIWKSASLKESNAESTVHRATLSAARIAAPNIAAALPITP